MATAADNIEHQASGHAKSAVAPDCVHAQEGGGEDTGVGALFASKAAVQLLIGPLAGGVIDRVGYDLPMMFGLLVMFFSTLLFACGSSYGVLFFARSVASDLRGQI